MTPATIQTHFEADKEKMVIRWVDANGTPIPSRGSVTIDLADLRTLGLSATNLVVKLRIEYAKDATGCALKKRGVLATDWEAG